MYIQCTAFIVFIQSIYSIILRPYPVAPVRYGRQLHLECETNNDWVSLSWRKNVQTYVFVFNQNNCNTITNGDFVKAECDKRENITFSSLIDVNPKRNDTWECLAVFPGNEIRQNRTKVDISGPYVELSNQTDVLYGDPAELNCTMDPKWSRCTWKKSDNDQEILSVTSCANISILNFSLSCIENAIILTVEYPIHLASYECVGFYYTDDGLVSTKETTIISINAEPPSLQISSEPLNPVEHYDFELQCIATGRPTPTTSWVVLDSEIEQGLGKSKIQFHNLKRTDSKEITCRATSSYLNKTMKAEILYNMTVLYPPEARIIGKMINQSDNIHLECLVEMGQPTNYNVSGWNHRVEGILIRKIDTTDNHLNFTKISIFDMGQYSCFVSNGITDGDGDILIRGSGNVSVLGSPYVVAGIKSYEVRIGEDVKIEVTVLSFPPLKHAWLSKVGSTGRIDMNLHRFMSYISFYGVDVLMPVQNATYTFSVTTERIGQYTIELKNRYFTNFFSLEMQIDGTHSGGKYQGKKTDTTVAVVPSLIGVVIVVSFIVGGIYFYRKRKKKQKSKHKSKKAEKDNPDEISLKASDITVKRFTVSDNPNLNDGGTYITPLKTDPETVDERRNIDIGNLATSEEISHSALHSKKEITVESSCPELEMCEQQTKTRSGYLEMGRVRRGNYVSMNQNRCSVTEGPGFGKMDTEQQNHYEEINYEEKENTENDNCYETIKDPSKTTQRQTDLRESDDGNADVKTEENISRKPDLPPRRNKSEVSEEETFSNTNSNVAKSSSDADHEGKGQIACGNEKENNAEEQTHVDVRVVSESNNDQISAPLPSTDPTTDDSNSASDSENSNLKDSIGFEKTALPETDDFNAPDYERSKESNNCLERSESTSSDKITQL